MENYPPLTESPRTVSNPLLEGPWSLEALWEATGVSWKDGLIFTGLYVILFATIPIFHYFFGKLIGPLRNRATVTVFLVISYCLAVDYFDVIDNEELKDVFIWVFSFCFLTELVYDPVTVLMLY